MFLFFFLIWINFIIFKKAFLTHGINIIWQNIPSSILSSYFSQTMFEAIIKIGVIPLILGGYVIYRYMFREKNRELYLLFGLAFGCFFLVWPKLLQPNVAFMFLGVILTILLAQWYKIFFSYLKKTKVAKYKILFVLLFVILFMITSIPASVYFINQKLDAAPTENDIEALNWIKENTEESSIIAASLKEGHLIKAIADRDNIMDQNFLLIENSEQRFQDLKLIYRANYKTDSIPLLNKYNSKYIFLSDTTRSEFDINKLNYIDKECFELVFSKNTKIYRSLCKVEII